MYKVNILNKSYVPTLGFGPFEEISITEELFRKLKIQGFNVIRKYDATDIKIKTGRKDPILLPGSTIQLEAFINPGDSLTEGLKWEVSNEDIITVDDNGLVSAPKEIKNDVSYATVTVTLGDLTDVIIVTTRKDTRYRLAPNVIEIQPTDGQIKMRPFSRTIIKINVSPSLNVGIVEGQSEFNEVDGLSMNPSLVKIIPTGISGEFSAESTEHQGSCYAEFRASNNPSLTKRILFVITNNVEDEEVPPELPKKPLTDLIITPSVISIKESQTVEILVSTVPSDADDKQFTFVLKPDVSNTVLGTIEGNKLTGTQKGETTLDVISRAKDKEGQPLVTKTIPVTIKGVAIDPDPKPDPKPVTIKATPGSITTELGAAPTPLKLTISPDTVSQEVSVSDELDLVGKYSDGKFTPTKVATTDAVFTSLADVTKKATVKITVNQPKPKTVVANPTKVDLTDVVDKVTIAGVVSPKEASQDVTYASKDISIATVNNKGEVSRVATKDGSTSITVTAAGTSAVNVNVPVTVKFPEIIIPTSIVVTPVKAELIGKDYKQELTVEVLPKGVSQDVTFTSSDSKLATVTNAGVVTSVVDEDVEAVITVASKGTPTIKTVVPITIKKKVVKEE